MQLEGRVKKLEAKRGGLDFVVFVWIEDEATREGEVKAKLAAIREKTGVVLDLNAPNVHAEIMTVEHGRNIDLAPVDDTVLGIPNCRFMDYRRKRKAQ